MEEEVRLGEPVLRCVKVRHFKVYIHEVSVQIKDLEDMCLQYGEFGRMRSCVVDVAGETVGMHRLP